MKNTIKTFFALICFAALFSCTDQMQDDAVKSVITADVTSINEIQAQNPSEVSVSISSNINWIVETPEWVTPSAIFGSGNSIISFTFASNYKNETTTTQPRSGEIKISGGGTTTGDGVTLIIPVTQSGFTYVDPSTPIGNIPNVDEFIKFLKAIMAGNEPTKWMDDNGEVVLASDIDLSGVEYDWTAHVSAVKNANNDCNVTGPAFTGVFNGNGYKITGFNPDVTLESGMTFGLFPAINGATIKDVELTGEMKISAKDVADAGMLVGTAFNSTVKNVTVKGKIISTGGETDNKRFALGGVCGFACARDDANTVFDNCVSDVVAEAVSGANTKNGATCCMYGGIIGFSTTPKDIPSRVQVKNCVNNGNMNVSLGRCSGIVGTANCGTAFENCTNNGNQVNAFGNARLANIVCFISQDCSMLNCVNNGDLETTAEKYNGTAGGLLALSGHSTVTVEGGGNYGTIKTTSETTTNRGLLWAYLNNQATAKNIVASGRLFIDGVEVVINETNYMEQVGRINSNNVSGITWVAPKN